MEPQLTPEQDAAVEWMVESILRKGLRLVPGGAEVTEFMPKEIVLAVVKSAALEVVMPDIDRLVERHRCDQRSLQELERIFSLNGPSS